MANSRRSNQSSAAAPPKHLGSEQPRIFTPPLRRLTAKTSLGFSVIEFADDIVQIDLLPWQRWLLIHALEILPDGSFRFRNVVVLVARQNGKSTLSQILALWFMYVYGVALVIGTAQDLDVAEEIWQGAVDLVQEVDDDDVPLRPELNEMVEKVVRVNGKMSLNLTTGQRWKIKAANRRAGRGLSGDLILLDELREHQTWHAWGAITKTTMARPEAQVWALSNAGDATSVVLAYLRAKAHAALGDPDGINGDEKTPTDSDLEVEGDDLGIFEWSATPGCEIRDRNGWAQANPSLGHTITERTVASAAGTDPEAVFRTEVLCQWVETLDDLLIDPDVWDDLEDRDTAAQWAPTAFSVSTDEDREWTTVGAAGPRSDGLTQIEVVKDGHRKGNTWTIPRCVELSAKFGRPVFVIDGSDPAATLIPGMIAAGLNVHTASSADAAAAYGVFMDAIRDDTIRHGPQADLRFAALAARTKPTGDGGRKFSQTKSGCDIGPLKSTHFAYWQATQISAIPEVYSIAEVMAQLQAKQAGIQLESGRLPVKPGVIERPDGSTFHPF